MHVELRGELRGRGHKFRTRSDNQQTNMDTVRSLLDDIVARQLVAEVEVADGETEHEQRMRVICYLHLIRFVAARSDCPDRGSAMMSTR